MDESNLTFCVMKYAPLSLRKAMPYHYKRSRLDTNLMIMESRLKTLDYIFNVIFKERRAVKSKADTPRAMYMTC